ncbi:bifunctional diaminohydroxyphosphoribosylaminopyrimidine deaminase/5-amino-6-(5-phosphoribosylamino)uracil reductase RibD [Ancylobacter sp. TS-1]|uniref:bifunctional diaminohydroxyphosphoribosylaminopyrimidine deaminase/5-amino-6-(5-phosphoribosylamino)uracil reductase RibD n=1 Tax=Ancylobacter sp. TS-1 TaxID=1850374 RepID=UPI001265C214|nr:bifunctional diaminohydroxyphosphoribosylaminopyrimidine deaminase/5-amino-6-(5-phosphoribosylamino)uracil reductase RibD [Ancylobacter sp. TS-1]QFR32292.1 bifunctional diaminohydroxyphosphoribosylaminopyrimidine deaminase/5-amino-6-(5-phosphoribosylamino)uracil reductase RibD [Ancylobacter sp. TS-1]
MTCKSRDEALMAAALSVGSRELGHTWPNPAVGALVVRETPQGPLVLGRGWTARGGRPHAEPQALAQAGEAARGATLYVTLEPCSHHGQTPPCVDAVRAAGIERVVAAIEDPDFRVAGRGFSILREAGIRVEVGTGAAAARLAHAGHIRRVTEGRPQVMLKLAVSADGKVGLAGRRPTAITGETARGRVHMMRATHDAVLTGIGTVLADDPQLTCRLPGMLDRSPLRVVLDAALRLPPTSALARSLAFAPLWVVAAEDAPDAPETMLTAMGIEVMRVRRRPDGALDLNETLKLLALRGITRLMVEAGPRIAAAFLRERLVDEANVFRAPLVLGAGALDALEGLPLSTLDDYLVDAGTEAYGSDSLRIMRRR